MKRQLSQHQADLVIVLIQLVSASSFLVNKIATRETPPMTFVSLRFLVSALILMVFYRGIWRQLSWPLVRASIAVGTAISIGTVCMTVGLTTTPAGHGAFLVSLSCLVTPFVDFLFTRKHPSRSTVFGVFVATVGLGFLSLTETLTLTVGTVWLLSSTLSFSLFTVFVSRYSRSFDIAALTTFQLFWAGIVALPLGAVFEGYPLPVTLSSWMCLLYITTFVTAFRHIMQSWAQRHTTATSVALLFTIEPVLASFYGWLFLSESFTERELFGCLLILLGTGFAKRDAVRALFLRRRIQPQLQAG